MWDKATDVVLVTGAGGFIGGHLVSDLLRQECRNVRAVDSKPFDEWYQLFPEADNQQHNLVEKAACSEVMKGVDIVFNLAADMGGIGFIETHKAECMISVLISTHMLMAARDCGVKRFFFSSSACVYPDYKQSSENVPPLKESDTYPAMPEDGYGWEKLFSERMYRHFSEDFGLETRVARYHNVYGPMGAYSGGREKAPAAICRKVIEAVLSGQHEIEIWGDGEQVRSFMFIDDCLKGTRLIMESDVDYPLNLGSSQLVTINQLVDIAESSSNVRLNRKYILDAPQGVRGRNSDNTLIKQELGWEPTISLEEGLEKTYRWIFDQMSNATPLASALL